MIDPIAAAGLESTPRIDISGGMPAGQQQNNGSDRRRAGAAASGGDTLTLSPEAQQQLAQLRQRDSEVRSHEQAHISAGGPHTGGASYTYQRGPDGRSYAVGGSVSIDTSPVPGDPDATLEKARQIRNAALAPGTPSAQDQSVASQAGRLEMQARAEKHSDAGEEHVEGPTGRGSSSVVLFKPAALKARGDKVAAAYQAVQDSAQPPTDLAPWGTGIAYVV